MSTFAGAGTRVAIRTGVRREDFTIGKQKAELSVLIVGEVLTIFVILAYVEAALSILHISEVINKEALCALTLSKTFWIILA